MRALGSWPVADSPMLYGGVCIATLDYALPWACSCWQNKQNLLNTQIGAHSPPPAHILDLCSLFSTSTHSNGFGIPGNYSNMLVLVQAHVPPPVAPCHFVVEQGRHWYRGSAFVALPIAFDRAPWPMQRPVPKHRRKVIFPSQRHLRLYHQLPKRTRKSHRLFR